jgi:hypothetical protein
MFRGMLTLIGRPPESYPSYPARLSRILSDDHMSEKSRSLFCVRTALSASGIEANEVLLRETLSGQG